MSFLKIAELRVKICGITNLNDAVLAARLGADAVGFVFYPESPRVVSPRKVKDIIRRLPPFITTVGVFANQEEKYIGQIVDECGIDIVQLQGDESPDLCNRFGIRVFKAIRVKDRTSLDHMKSYHVRAFVLDTYRENQLGGTGFPFDWGLAVEAKKYGQVILAGGLTPENVRKAIREVNPAGVDVSSGVERRMGQKDPEKIRRFIEEAKQSFDGV